MDIIACMLDLYVTLENEDTVWRVEWLESEDEDEAPKIFQVK